MELGCKQTVTEFARLFQGRQDVWGTLHGQAVKKPVTLAHYSRHVQGQTSLGIYPLTRAGVVRWFAIDIDRQDPTLALQLIAALASLGIDQGIYLERSRGKGYHVLVFLSDWASAVAVRRIAKAALQNAGLPVTTEIFPKQDRLTKVTPWGSYLNLPYFGGDNPEGRRMVLNPDNLVPIPLQAWLEEVTCFPVESLESIALALPEEPPASAERGRLRAKALDQLSSTHPAGTRRPTLVSLTGHLRVRGVNEDVAVELLLSWAREHFSPPLPNEEIEKHVRGIYRRYSLGNRLQAGYEVGQVLPTIEVSW
jgi:hypothetical protein